MSPKNTTNQPSDNRQITLSSPDFYVANGDRYKDRGLPEEALIEYLQAAKLAPNDVTIAVKIYEVYMNEMRREERAVLELEKMRMNFPDKPEPWFHSGNFHLSRGEYEQALEYYRKTLRIAPGFARALNNLGVLYNSIGKYDLAEKVFFEALNVDPDNYTTHKNLGVLYDPAEQRMPDAVKARYHYQRCLSIGGDDDAAIREWLAALKGANTP